MFRAPMQAAAEEESDGAEEEGEEGAMAAGQGGGNQRLGSGVQVLRGSTCGAEEEESRSEGGGEDAAAQEGEEEEEEAPPPPLAAGSSRAPAAPAPSAASRPATPVPVAPALVKQEEADAEMGEEPEEGQEDGGEEEEEEAEDEAGEEAAPLATEVGSALVKAASPESRGTTRRRTSSAEEDEEGTPPRVPLISAQEAAAAGGSDGLAESLPLEASGEWTSAEDFCSLQVAGATMKLPRSVHERLYGYQRQGVAWMWNLFHKGFGGILGDEMGLGKTVQTAAFLACLKCTEQASHFLVVMPVTLLAQWRRELQTWAKDTGLAVHVMHGTGAERQKALAGLRRSGGVLLVSYDLVRNCINSIRTAGLACAAPAKPVKRKRQDARATRDDDSPSEAEDQGPPARAAGQAAGEEDDPRRPWDVVILDEGQQIKNPSCASGRALRKLEARTRFVLTGTPLQNKLTDLWALMDFAQPALLGNHATFERTFSEQIAKGLKRNASRFAVELKDHLARELKRLTAPHFLRRLKSEVSMTSATPPSRSADPSISPQQATASHSGAEELPRKVDVVLWLNLTQAQMELYNLFLGSDIVRRAAGESKCGMEALRAIALLKKLCNHPLLCLPQEEFNQWRAEIVAPGGAGAAPAAGAPPAAAGGAPLPGGAAPEADEDMGGTQPAAETQHVLPRLRALVPGSVHGAALLSCKLRVLSVLLPQLQRRGHRCLIFSQSTRMLDLIQACVLRVLGLKFLRIDGSIEAKDRDLKLAKFQQPDSRYFCICLSVQVGGTGLTITAADRVVLVDPAWNPSVDAQAIDRVHRIGQQREVVVYRLVGAGAIEDKMFRLQVFKRGLSKTYLEQEQQVRFFTHKELKQLFEPPDQSKSTQSLMAEQIGLEALEHEELLRVVAGDIGSTDDPQALPFWQSSDVLGFSDYQRLFMFLEQSTVVEEEAQEKAKVLAARLRNEEYVKDQVVHGKLRASQRDVGAKENMPPDSQGAPLPLGDVDDE